MKEDKPYLNEQPLSVFERLRFAETDFDMPLDYTEYQQPKWCMKDIVEDNLMNCWSLINGYISSDPTSSACKGCVYNLNRLQRTTSTTLPSYEGQA